MWTNVENPDLSDDNLKLTFHTKFITLIFFIGLFFIFIVAHISLKGLKADYDSNFPVFPNELNLLSEFQNEYISMVLGKNMDSTNPQPNSQKLWNLYKKLYINNSIKRHEGAFNFLRELYKSVFLSSNFHKLQQLESTKEALIRELDDIVQGRFDEGEWLDSAQSARRVSQLGASIVSTEAAIHIIEKDITTAFFGATLNILYVVTLLVFTTVMSLSLVILRFAQRFNIYLKKLFDDATEELRHLNTNLQQEVGKQVGIIREKDKIMYAQAKFASMGEMIQNIAHQWRQPLNSIILIVQAIKIKFDNGTLTSKTIQEQTTLALTIAQNMSNTIDNFRSFFRMEGSRCRFNIKETLLDSLALNKPAFHSLDIHTHVNCPDDIIIYGNKEVLIQALLVLLSNSKDAFIESKMQDGSCFINAERSREYITINYHDNCGGIKDDIIENIFEPYFSTKHSKVGTGIGLYMAKELLNNYLHANINVSNHYFTYGDIPSKGALFTIKIPILQEKEHDE